MPEAAAAAAPCAVRRAILLQVPPTGLLYVPADLLVNGPLKPLSHASRCCFLYDELQRYISLQCGPPALGNCAAESTKLP